MFACSSRSKHSCHTESAAQLTTSRRKKGLGAGLVPHAVFGETHLLGLGRLTKFPWKQELSISLNPVQRTPRIGQSTKISMDAHVWVRVSHVMFEDKVDR